MWPLWPYEKNVIFLTTDPTNLRWDQNMTYIHEGSPVMTLMTPSLRAEHGYFMLPSKFCFLKCITWHPSNSVTLFPCLSRCIYTLVTTKLQVIRYRFKSYWPYIGPPYKWNFGFQDFFHPFFPNLLLHSYASTFRILNALSLNQYKN